MLLLRADGGTASGVGRLAWQIAFTLMLAMGVVGAGMYEIARFRLELEVDNALRRDQRRLLPEGVPDGPGIGEMTRKLAQIEGERIISEKGHALFDPGGRQIFGHIRLPLPTPGISTVTFADGPHTGRDGRALTIRLRDGSWLVIVAQSEIVEDLGTTLLPLTLSLFLAAGMVGLLSNWLLGRLLADRIERTTQVAGAIAAGNLSQRVPVAGLDGIFKAQAEAFNHMLDRMEELIRNHEQFSWNVAHDLRSPLTRLQGLLTGSAESKIGRERMIEQATQECDGLIRTFEALLRLAELEGRRKQRHLELLELDDLAAEISETMEPVLADRSIALNLATPVEGRIYADRDLMMQLFVNLLDNVALHTPPGTAATISFEGSPGAHNLRIVLRDNGPGLRGTDPQQILEPFVRGAGSAATRGSGLGLSVALAIARFHGGTLSLKETDPGLEVAVTLPLAA